MNMRDEMLDAGLYRCIPHGYELCHQRSKWIVIEQWATGTWAATHVCQKHALDILEYQDSLLDPPQSRTWWTVADFERSGEWPKWPD